MSALRVTSGVRIFMVIVVIAVGVLTSLVPGVLADDGPKLLTGSAVVTLPQSGAVQVRPETARRELVQGSRIDADCRFSMSFGSTGKDVTPQAVRMVAVDPTSCTAEIERGVPTSLPALQGDQRKARKPAMLRDGVDSEGQNKNRQATHWTIWEDPAKATVAIVRNSIKSKVKNKQIQRANCTQRLDPLEQTGWQIENSSKKFDCDWSDKKASSVSSAHFFNDDFLGIACSGRDRTHIYVQDNYAKVSLKDEFGSVSYTYSSGGCSTLLGWGAFWEPGVYYE